MKNDKIFKEQLNEIQDNLKSAISLKNTIEVEKINLVAGVDIAYWSEHNKDFGVCCISILNYHDKKIIEQVEFVGEVEFPYIPGYLAFRELPLIINTVKKVKKSLTYICLMGMVICIAAIWELQHTHHLI